MDTVFKTSRTRENLMRAFAGESQARNRYTIAAEACKKAGMQALGQIFLFTAEQERAHAERYYDLLKQLSGDTITISGGYPVDHYDEVTRLLRAAEHNEMEEYESVYPEFGNVAKEEGFPEAASAFFLIAEVEKIHARRFGKLRELLENGQYFERPQSGLWMCLNCGHVQSGRQVPQACPACAHDRGYFIPLELAPYCMQDFV